MLCDGLFPSGRSLEIREGEEEERRLMYVAITRARERALSELSRSSGPATARRRPVAAALAVPGGDTEGPGRGVEPEAVNLMGNERDPAKFRVHGFEPLQVFGEELGEFLEFGDVLRVDVHERLVGFEAGAGDSSSRVRGRVRAGFGSGGASVSGAWVSLNKCSTPRFSSNSVMRGFGFNNSMPGCSWSSSPAAHLQAEPGQRAEKGAVHQHAFGEVQHEILAALCCNSLNSVLKSMLEMKLARPSIFRQANCSPTNTNILADGVLMRSRASDLAFARSQGSRCRQFAPASAATPAIRPGCWTPAAGCTAAAIPSPGPTPPRCIA